MVMWAAGLFRLLLSTLEPYISETKVKFLYRFLIVGVSGLVGCASEDTASLKTHDAPVVVTGFSNSVGMKFNSLPAGNYTTNVTGLTETIELLHPIEFGVHEVTQAQYKAVMNSNPSKFKGDSHPVENVRWEEIAEFCRRLSNLPEEKAAGNVYRLPTVEEWEYACRAGVDLKNRFDHHLSDLGAYAWFLDNADGGTHPVGTKEPNAWGLHDMHGGVWGWCADFYDPEYYFDSPLADPAGPEAGVLKVLQGGSWFRYAKYARSSYRRFFHPESDSDAVTAWVLDFGCRLVINLEGL